MCIWNLVLWALKSSPNTAKTSKLKAIEKVVPKGDRKEGGIEENIHVFGI